MKICPQCQTKYTDDTLNFCLQDGKTLDVVTDEKTLVLDAESFANEATISENIEVDPKGTSKNAENIPRQRVEIPTADNPSKETVVNRVKTNDQPPITNEIRSTRSGWTFVAGFLIGISGLLVVSGLIYGAVLFFSSGFGRQNTNSNSNTNTSPPKERVLSNSDEVTVASSSTRRAEKGNFYTPKLAFDGNPRTAWAEGAVGPGIGQWIAFDFEKEVNLKEIVIMPGYFKTQELWSKNNRLASAVFEFSDQTTKIVDFPDKMEEQKIDVGGVRTKSVLIRIKGYHRGLADAKDTLISEVSFVVE